MKHIIVPVDGSTESWRVVDVAIELVGRRAGRIEVVEVVFDPNEVQQAEGRLADGIRGRSIAEIDLTGTVELSVDGVAHAIRTAADRRPSATVMMASRGAGRSAALLGSVAEDVLRQIDGPVVIVGPRSQIPDFSGPIVVTVDGSDTSEAAIPIAASWSLELGVSARVVHVMPPGDVPMANGADLSYLTQVATRFTTLSGGSAEPEVLSGRDVGAVVADYATSVGASLIVTSTHGRTATARFLLGSAASGFVRHAPCPVLAIRPKHFGENAAE